MHEKLLFRLKKRVTVNPEKAQVSTVPGGSINNTYRVSTSGKSWFVKESQSDMYADCFAREAQGLQILAHSNTFLVPSVVAHINGSPELLVLEWLESDSHSGDDWADFGRKLAQLHRCTDKSFGLDHDNYIGLPPQKNTQYSSWISFFIEMRLNPLVKLAFDNQLMDSSYMLAFDALYKNLDALFPDEPPSLLRGDLWNGNMMFTTRGPAIFDPSVYYGHRMMDIAMMKLFGGFDNRAFASYCEAFPFDGPWDKCIMACNLYPLLVHLNLFGKGYLPDIQTCLKQLS